MPLLEMDADQVRDALSDHVVMALDVARNAAPKMRPGGTLVLMGGTGGRKISRGLGLVSAATAVLPPFTATLALELAPVRVNLIAAGFVDTPLSASLLGERLDERRDDLERISEILLVRETIDADEFVALLEGASEEEVFPPESGSTEEDFPSEPEPVNTPTTDPAPSPPRPGYAGGMTD